MDSRESVLHVGSYVYYNENKVGIVCAISDDGEQVILYKPDTDCFEDCMISCLSTYGNNEQLNFVEKMITVLDNSYNTFNFQPKTFKNQKIYDFYKQDGFVDGLLSDDCDLLDECVNDVQFLTFYQNSPEYNEILKSDPVCVTSSQSSFIDLQCHCVSVLPCRAIPSICYPAYCNSKSIYSTSQTYIYLYSIGSSEQYISVQSPFSTSSSSHCKHHSFQSCHHNSCFEVKVSEQSIVIQFDEIRESGEENGEDEDGRIASFFTFAISDSLSVLSYYIFIRDPSILATWLQVFQPSIPLPSSINQIFHSPETVSQQQQILTMASLLNFYVRSPSRIHSTRPSLMKMESEVVVDESMDTTHPISLYIPYLRCFVHDPLFTYIESKYDICKEENHSHCFDDISSVVDLERSNAWVERGGTFIIASMQNPIMLNPTDSILYIHDSSPDMNYFSLLEHCSFDYFQSSSRMITQLLPNVKQVYAIATSKKYLNQLIDHLVLYYCDYISLITLVYFDRQGQSQNTQNFNGDEEEDSIFSEDEPSLEKQLIAFNNFACVFRPSLSVCSSQASYFHIDSLSHSINIQQTSEITPTAKVVEMNGEKYLCFWDESQWNQEFLYTKFRQVNEFYERFQEFGECVIPPLYKVVCGIESGEVLIDVYFMGPFSPDTTFEQLSFSSSQDLSRLLQAFNLLWEMGYLLNISQCIAINGQACFYDLSTLISVASIPVNSRKEYYTIYRDALIRLFTISPDDQEEQAQEQAQAQAQAQQEENQHFPIHQCSPCRWDFTPCLESPSKPVMNVKARNVSFLIDRQPDSIRKLSSQSNAVKSFQQTPAFWNASEVIVNSDDSVQVDHSQVSELSNLSDLSDLSDFEEDERRARAEQPSGMNVNMNAEMNNSIFFNEPSSPHRSQLLDEYSLSYSEGENDYSLSISSSRSRSRSRSTSTPSFTTETNSSFYDLAFDKPRYCGLTEEEVRLLLEEEEEEEGEGESEKEISIDLHLSPAECMIDKEEADRLFKESNEINHPQQQEAKTQPTVLQPCKDSAREEIRGSRKSLRLSRHLNPIENIEWKKNPKGIPFYGDESNAIIQQVTEQSIESSLNHICELLSKRIQETAVDERAKYQSGFGKDVGKGKEVLEMEEIPEFIPENQTASYWCDRGESKD